MFQYMRTKVVWLRPQKWKTGRPTQFYPDNHNNNKQHKLISSSLLSIMDMDTSSPTAIIYVVSYHHDSIQNSFNANPAKS
jgi:hypothetical protein